MAKIQVLMLPEKGHLNSSFKLAKSLKSRGHAVVYSQLFAFEEYIRAEGLDFDPLFPEVFPKGYQVHRNYNVSLLDELEIIINQLASVHHQTGRHFLQNELAAMFERVKPQLLLLDSSFAKPVIPNRRAGDPPCI